ncbi:hypothetical protein [Winogradskyella sp. PG-2]|uniref:hypothetical protein n=1 Tax=Winogradskyella sp. PG-2 TaxID=754409 RepID=UPI00045895C5|nr:hypothetical protein [Winogradskyella sp. PG-2]BAO74889.1 hypothetical protein WPG_0659 [Winogradskyella sp. PG-2]
MNFKPKTKEFIKICVFAITMSLVAIHSKSISNYLIDSYNSKVDFLANNTLGTTYLTSY